MSQILLASYGPTVGPISPDDLAGLIMWLKADALVLSDNDPVATWTDSSSAGNDAIAAGAARPTFKTGILNSLPIVRFDGGNNILTVTAITYGEFTIFYVYKTTSGGIIGEHSVNAGANNGDYHYQPGGAHFACTGAGGFSAYDLSAPSLADGTFRYISRVMDGTNAGHLAWVNGILGTRTNFVGSGDPGTATNSNNYFIGARSGPALQTTGDIAEIIIYDNALSDANRQGIEAYIANKYAL